MSSLGAVTSSASESTKEETPIFIRKHNKSLRELVLNNSAKTHPLNSQVTDVITSQLKIWEDSDRSKVIIVKGSVGESFSMCGNYKEILGLSKSNKAKLLNMVQAQYKMFYSIAYLKTAYVAIMDGVTMGEGAALSIHGRFRIATENTCLSIPELSVGITPNAGCNYYMARLDGQLGTYLILTGQPISGSDLLLSGLATHYVPSSSVADIEHHLNYLDRNNSLEDVNDVIEQFSSKSVDHNSDNLICGAKRKLIDSCFDYDTVEEIVSALKNDGSDFALETRDVILSNSPTASKIALEKLRKAKYMTIAECLESDFNNFKNDIERSDFGEGIKSRVIENSQPKWSPYDDGDSNPQVHYLDSVSSVNNKSGLKLPLQNVIKTTTSRFALPTEDDIRRYAVGLSTMTSEGKLKPATSFEQVVLYFVSQQKGKVGVTQKVKEVLERKARIIHNNHGSSVVEWNYGI